MGRSILAVIAGYFAMTLFVFVGFSVFYLVLGPDRAYQPGSYEVSTTWSVGALVIGLVVAVIGGYVCALIAKRPKPPLVLAALFLVIGLLIASLDPKSHGPDPGPRTEDIGVMEAMKKLRTPAWSTYVAAVIGSIGVVIGARMRKQKS